MKKGLTDLVFILDRSGSMSGLESDTIGGYNAMLEKQKKEAGEARISTVLFDNEYELLHDGIDLQEVNPITEREYYVRGTTALLDAIGRTISKIRNLQNHVSEEEIAEHIMFVIITDGYENASKEYTLDKVRMMIEEQRDKHSWEFIFLGANIDAIATAESFGIREDRASNFKADSEGVSLNYEVISEAVSELRVNKSLAKDWKDRIEDDIKKRGR